LKRADPNKESGLLEKRLHILRAVIVPTVDEEIRPIRLQLLENPGGLDDPMDKLDHIPLVGPTLNIMVEEDGGKLPLTTEVFLNLESRFANIVGVDNIPARKNSAELIMPYLHIINDEEPHLASP
jgi:hypothetical protein